jgi:hypothetical protein
MLRGLPAAARITAFLLVAGFAKHVAAQQQCNNTPAYSTCDIVFELPEQDAARHPKPYVSVELRIEFRSPRQRTFMIPAFWDGGRRMVVRFAPTEGGEWAYRTTSNIAEWDGKNGTFSAGSSEAPGFIRSANVHHWAYTERNLPHLWMGANELGFAGLDDAAFRAVADARALQKFNHLRGYLLDDGSNPGYSGPDEPDVARFQRVDDRLRYLNQKGIVADLIMAASPAQVRSLFPSWEQRRRFVRYLGARYAAFSITWQAVGQFEDDLDGRALLKEIGGVLKEADPYQHPRSSGARITSAPLLDDGWMTFAAYGTSDDSVGAVEHQLYAVPFVNFDFGREDSGAGKARPSDGDATAFRRRLWNATMNGQYVTYNNTGSGAAFANSAAAKQMTVWFDFFDDTRHWELEPWFDVDGGRALALDGTEYIMYIEKPGPVEMLVEKHGYDVLWVNPIDGAVTRAKFKGDHFTGEPPDKSHDWVLHVVREGRVESMNKSYRFESREVALQEIEQNSSKVPFDIEQPTGDLVVGKATAFSAKIKRETRATRTVTWMWTGEVAADGQGYRVLATGAQGTLAAPPTLAKNFPAVMNLRLYGMNANGKVYALDRALQLSR